MATKPSLTARQIEILSLISQGLPSEEVANQVFVSKRTVDFHLRNIFRRLRVKNRVQAMVVARQWGLIA